MSASVFAMNCEANSSVPDTAGTFRRLSRLFSRGYLGSAGTCEYAAYIALAASAFLASFSMPAARAAAAISLVLLVVHSARTGSRIAFPATAILATVFALFALFATCHGMHPEIGLPRMWKLVWWFIVPLSATLAGSARRRDVLIKCMVAGMLVLALRQFTAQPWTATRIYQSGATDSFIGALVCSGSMTDGQRLMVGVIIALAWVLQRKQEDRSASFPVIVLGACLVALVLSFKRGSWICAVLCGGLLATRGMSIRGFLLLLLAGTVVLCLPPVLDRILALQGEFQEGNGGRFLMWRDIAPVIIRDHPWGIGWRGLTNEWMRQIAPAVEMNQTHLHSNILQVIVETGWAGFAVYAAWMMKALLDALGLRSAAGSAGEAKLALGLFFALLALMLNGIVEYNFADAEIVLLYAFLMGLTAAGFREYSARRKLSGLCPQG